MISTNVNQKSVRVHLTNVAGVGASQLLQSLLPELENCRGIVVEHIYLPDRGNLAKYHSVRAATVVEIYTRTLPNAISRLLECTLLASHFDGDSPLLVLGDLPLRCRGPQVVFVQTPNMLKPSQLRFGANSLKYWISRLLFRLGLNRVYAFIVQTDVMRKALEQSYPDITGRVYVVAQPVPSWLLHCGLRRQGRVPNPAQGLDLIYPAAGYPHKNHLLLSRLDPSGEWPVNKLILTLSGDAHPAPRLSWVQCRGFLSPSEMIAAYSTIDALLFLSKDESYGFPLVEAMFVGLPVVCPDLPYARTLCGDQAFYFHPDQPESLRTALLSLKSRLNEGWWPDWQAQLSKIPSDWNAVASKFLEITCSAESL